MREYKAPAPNKNLSRTTNMLYQEIKNLVVRIRLFSMVNIIKRDRGAAPRVDLAAIVDAVG
jgi:hypothetical protein